jgi:hypothetical protein
LIFRPNRIVSLSNNVVKKWNPNKMIKEI